MIAICCYPIKFFTKIIFFNNFDPEIETYLFIQKSG